VIQATFDILIRWRRLLAERTGNDAHSWPGLNNLDRKLDALLGDRPGFFIEAGANDVY
jgi:hypothetical protein